MNMGLNSTLQIWPDQNLAEQGNHPLYPEPHISINGIYDASVGVFGVT